MVASKMILEPPAGSNSSVKQRPVAEYALLHVKLVAKPVVSHVHEKPVVGRKIDPHSRAMADRNRQLFAAQEPVGHDGDVFPTFPQNQPSDGVVRPSKPVSRHADTE